MLKFKFYVKSNFILNTIVNSMSRENNVYVCKKYLYIPKYVTRACVVKIQKKLSLAVLYLLVYLKSEQMFFKGC